VLFDYTNPLLSVTHTTGMTHVKDIHMCLAVIRIVSDLYVWGKVMLEFLT